MWVGSERQRKRGMKTNGILIHESDHVVTLTLPVKAGEAVTYIRKGISWMRLKNRRFNLQMINKKFGIIF